MQYSVFAVEASNAKMGTLMAHIATLIDAREDDVRAYRLPEKRLARHPGRCHAA